MGEVNPQRILRRIEGTLQQLVVQGQCRSNLLGEEGIQIFPAFPTLDQIYGIRSSLFEAKFIREAVERQRVRFHDQ